MPESLPPSPDTRKAESDSAFTPGPWLVEDNDGQISVMSTATRGWSCFGLVSYDRELADARLIAAAPDMYAALSWALEFGMFCIPIGPNGEHLPPCGDCAACKDRTRAECAIAKVEGRT